MDTAIQSTWDKVGETIRGLEPLDPPRRCHVAVCSEPAVIFGAREHGTLSKTTVTPMDVTFCRVCAWWETERASMLAWAGRDPRLYLAYVRAGLCVRTGLDSDETPLRLTVDGGRTMRGRLDAALLETFGPCESVFARCPDLRVLCWVD